MLLEFLDQLCVELDITPVPKMDEKKVIHFQIGNEAIEIRDLQPGVALFGKICPCLKKKRRAIFEAK